MKNANKERIGMLALVASLLAMPSFAQTGADIGAGAELNVEATADSETLANAEFSFAGGLGLTADIERLPEHLRDEAEALRAAREELRAAWDEDFRPAADATILEIRAARQAFRDAYAAKIEASRELRRDLVAELRETVRDRFDDAEWNEQARELYQEYQDVKQELAEAWRAVLAQLGDGATRAEIRVARERFLEANAELVLEQKELAQEIRDLIAANRPERPIRGPLPEELQALRDDIRVVRETIRERKREAREALPGLSPEERQAYLTDLRADLREAHEDIKEARRAVIDDLRDGDNGDRRSED